MRTSILMCGGKDGGIGLASGSVLHSFQK